MRPSIPIICPVGGVWTEVPIWQEYRGRDLLLWPESEGRLACATVRLAQGEHSDDAYTLLRRFLSAATWSLRLGLMEYMRSGGGSPYPLIGRGPLLPAFHQPSQPQARPLEAPEPTSQSALLSLALYRDALCASPAIFQFLGFFKILETVASGRSALSALAERHLPQARKQCHKLPQAHLSDSDLGQHLYKQGRCAVAHAHQQPLVDPDKTRDTTDVSDLVPLMRAVAELVIEKEHCVPRFASPASPPSWRRVEEKGGVLT